MLRLVYQDSFLMAYTQLIVRTNMLARHKDDFTMNL